MGASDCADSPATVLPRAAAAWRVGCSGYCRGYAEAGGPDASAVGTVVAPGGSTPRGEDAIPRDYGEATRRISGAGFSAEYPAVVGAYPPVLGDCGAMRGPWRAPTGAPPVTPRACVDVPVDYSAAAARGIPEATLESVTPPWTFSPAAGSMPVGGPLAGRDD